MSLFTATTVEEVKRLIELGHDVNSIDECDRSVLHRACRKNNLDIVKALCEAGADVNKQRNDYYPIDIAAKAGYLDIVKYLIKNYPVKLDTILYKASAGGYIDVIDYLLTLNLELAKPVFDLNSSYKNPLINACVHTQIDVIDRLLYAGANTNIANQYGSTTMIIATCYNRLDIIKRLVMFGANYHTYGSRSLIISCEYSYNEISEFLIELGCNVNCCINYMTPLIYSCIRNNLKIVKLLLKRGANVNYRTGNMTPLIYCCIHNNLKIIKLLLKRGADPNFVNYQGKKAIDYCKSDEARALFIKN